MSAPNRKPKVPAKLKRLAAELDIVCKQAEEFARDENSSLAEYCQSFGYGEGDIEFGRLSDKLEAKVKTLRKLTGDSFHETLSGICTLELTNMFTTDDEVFSCCIGEIEEQVDDKLAKRIKRLKPDELEILRREMREGCLGHTCTDCVYVSLDYERWVMRVNEGDLDRLLKRLGCVEKAKAEVPNVLLSETPEVRRQAFRLILGGAA